jgi:hypothetical protein
MNFPSTFRLPLAAPLLPPSSQLHAPGSLLPAIGLLICARIISVTSH